MSIRALQEKGKAPARYMKKHEKLRLVALVSDCITYRFADEEAHIYIRARLGREIPQGTYRHYKTFLLSGKGADIWYDNMARVGAAVEYRRRCDEMLKLYDDVMHDIAMEMIVRRDQRDWDRIAVLRKQAMELNRQLVSLQMGQPIVARMRELVRDAERLQIMVSRAKDGELSEAEKAIPDTSTLTLDEIRSDMVATFRDNAEQALKENPVKEQLPATEF